MDRDRRPGADNSRLAVVYLLYMAAAGGDRRSRRAHGIVDPRRRRHGREPGPPAALGVRGRARQRRVELGHPGSAGHWRSALATTAAAACLMRSALGSAVGSTRISTSPTACSVRRSPPSFLAPSPSAAAAGMLAFETAGAAAIGVAISVTTVPAAAYVGDALALGRANPMGGATGCPAHECRHHPDRQRGDLARAAATPRPHAHRRRYVTRH